jgi:hypothetical protein
MIIVSVSQRKGMISKDIGPLIIPQGSGSILDTSNFLIKTKVRFFSYFVKASLYISIERDGKLAPGMMQPRGGAPAAMKLRQYLNNTIQSCSNIIWS